jgi:hypothetical protein
MAVTAMPGPLVVFGDRNPSGTGSTASTNPDKAPSLVWGGVGLIDPRAGYNRTKYGTIGFMSNTMAPVVDAVPSTISAVNIAASQSPAAGAITLVTVTGAGVTVLSATQTVFPSGNVMTVGALALDGPSGLTGFGSANLGNSGQNVISLYDPSKMLSRIVRITSGGNDSGITFTVNGHDIYGFNMTETITGANAGVASGRKAFKYIDSITHTGSVASTITIGTGDVFGFPIRSDVYGYARIIWNNATIAANTGFTAADTTSPATAVTGDVRGTYLVVSASDGTKRLIMFMTPSVANLGTTVGLFGVAQV